MNTGWIVNDEGPGSRKISVADSSHCLTAIAEGNVEWDLCDDFGYQLAESLPGLEGEDAEILDPKRAFKRLGREDEYDAWVKKLKKERRVFLEGFPGLDPAILNGL
jgi:ATP-dependent phosphoenolpyruvate carboxykinase